jgi:hypothetical protein
LGIGDPLQVLLEQHLARELTARMIDVGRFAALKGVGPQRPRPFPLARVDRSEERVVLNPPRLLAEKCLQLPAPRRAAAPFGLEKSRERRPERRFFQTADFRVLDAGGAADLDERGAVIVAERVLAAERREFGDLRHGDEDRVDRHRADRRIGRLLAGRHFVDGEQLQHALARRGKPGGDRGNIAHLADAPADGRRARKQGNE